MRTRHTHGERPRARSRLLLLLLPSIVATVVAVSVPAYPAMGQSTTGAPPPEQPERGITYDDLVAGSPLCPGGLFKLASSSLCTHGPDPAPEGTDLEASPPPVRAAEDVSPAIACEGDGLSGFRTQVVYARSSDQVDRYATYLASFRTWAAQAMTYTKERGRDRWRQTDPVRA